MAPLALGVLARILEGGYESLTMGERSLAVSIFGTNCCMLQRGLCVFFLSLSFHG